MRVTTKIIKAILVRLYKTQDLELYCKGCHIWVEKAWGGKSFQLGIDLDERFDQ